MTKYTDSIGNAHSSNNKKGGLIARPLGCVGSVILIVQILCSGCATTNRTKTLIGMLAGGAVGAAIGYPTTPTGTDPAMHSAYVGMAGAVAMGVAGLFLFDEQKNSQELERKLRVAQAEISGLRGEERLSQEILYEGRAPVGRSVPKQYQGLVTPGSWQVYKLNQWVKSGDSTLIHQDRMMRLTPAVFSPNQLGNVEKTAVVPSEAQTIDSQGEEKLGQQKGT